MKLVLRPEPPAAEREAIARALERLLEEPDARPSAWWEAGVVVLGDGAAAEDAWGDAGVVEP